MPLTLILGLRLLGFLLFVFFRVYISLVAAAVGAACNPGREVVAFVPKRWNSNRAGAFLNSLDEAGIVTIKADGSVSLPKRYHLKAKATTLPTRKAELLQVIRDSVERES